MISPIAIPDWPLLAQRGHFADRRAPENRRPQFLVLEIVVWQGQPLADDRQNAQLEDVSH
jgi:hypothetical protein